jgi:hypothetical protein
VRRIPGTIYLQAITSSGDRATQGISLAGPFGLTHNLRRIINERHLCTSSTPNA